jgi:ferredoxin
MSGALTPRKGGGVKFDRNACFACKKCIDACPVGVIDFDEETHIPIICVQCGACAKHCPYGCLEMVEVKRHDYIDGEDVDKSTQEGTDDDR